MELVASGRASADAGSPLRDAASLVVDIDIPLVNDDRSAVGQATLERHEQSRDKLLGKWQSPSGG